MAEGDPATGFEAMKQAMLATAVGMAPVANVARALNDYADHLTGGKPALMNTAGQLSSRWTSEAGDALTDEFTKSVAALDGVADLLHKAAAALVRLTESVDRVNGVDVGNAANPFAAPDSLYSLEARQQAQQGEALLTPDAMRQVDDQLVKDGQELIQRTLGPDLQGCH